MLRDVEKQNMKYHLQPEIADVYLVPSFLRPFSSIFLPQKNGVLGATLIYTWLGLKMNQRCPMLTNSYS